MIAFLVIFTSINILLWIFVFIKYKKMISSDFLLKDIRIEINNLLTELNLNADRNITLLDDRIKTLRTLTKEVDSKLKLWEKTVDSKEREKKVFSSLSQKENNAVTAYQKMQDNAEIIDVDFDLYHKAEQTDNEETDFINDVEVEIPEIINKGKNELLAASKKDRVLSLYNEGFSADLIAIKLKIPIREVQLYISLYR